MNHRPTALLLTLVLTLSIFAAGPAAADDLAGSRPNILFVFADDWSRPHAGYAGDPAAKTPTIDRLAEEGVSFNNAYISVSSCTPARGAVLTGQWFARLEHGALLHSTLPAKFPVYPDLLEEAGYHVGFTRKGWGPGNVQAGGRDRNPAGPRFDDFEAFLDARKGDAPFSFWFGTKHPHRPYSDELIEEKGIDPEAIEIPPFLPDAEPVRRDLANYYAEVADIDDQIKGLLAVLEERGELEDTVIVISSDNGMPFPRAKSNAYDIGHHVPLVVHWPGRIDDSRTIEDFVHVNELAPTFLALAGAEIPQQMTGRSLLPILDAQREGRIDPRRSHILLGKERHHGKSRVDNNAYPIRGIRTERYLYLRNFKPDRWPAGAPDLSSSQGVYSDVDDGPTKQWMIEHRHEEDVAPLFRLAFEKRPAEELYDLEEDPHQMNNLAGRAEYQPLKQHLRRTMMAELEALEDPRVLGEGDQFDEYEYFTGYGMKEVEGKYPPEP